MSKSTKIVATISDLRCEVDFIRSLYNEGMNVVRMNSAHLQREGFERIVNNVRAVSNQIAILMDTKGPEIRTTVVENDSIDLSTGDTVKITGNPDLMSTRECISVNYPHFVRDLNVGDNILFDDGEIDLQVDSKDDQYLYCTVLNNGNLGSRKSVNVPGVRINLPSLTEKDRKNILLAIELDLDFIAHSFVRNKQDLIDIQTILDEHNSPIKIISKIENQEGVDNIDEILEHTYGVMIARGDLGIEVAQEKIPGIQRRLIRKCVVARKPVIVATQMLHTMIKNPRPTRAEITDIANAIYYRTDAVMLSGETAYGKYPVEAVRTMASVAKEAEKTKLTENDIPVNIGTNDITSFLANAANEASINLGTKAIITDTYTGKTALNLSAYRSTNPILALCYHERSTRQLALSYGVFPVFQEEKGNTQKYFIAGLQGFIKQGMLEPEDYVSYLSGSFGSGFGTSFLEINQVSKIFESREKYILPNF
ncbi:pyruvate kinase [Paludibacter propionicigenes WB4]|uniref:Pyruvate kinase n=1 Tax=Paludibacter propionicigenes (strain DSM 17365 / JCM 13257 / WB4) TaxID=694427 RepID=E4T6N7_PALPW|nr:pyruvate kinase [Paludibacter propionicigenes]ADQ80381.1 pyruvate kinase [Paludibacter propionicigenes WB4]